MFCDNVIYVFNNLSHLTELPTARQVLIVKGIGYGMVGKDQDRLSETEINESH